MRRYQSLLVLGLLAALAVGALLAVRFRDQRALQHELESTSRAMDAGRFATARRSLVELAARYPRSDEVLFRLGVCERELGRYDEAIRAWERVPAGTARSNEAAAALATEYINVGRYRKAEDLLLAARDQAGAALYQLERALIRLYRFQGRNAEVRRLLQSSLNRSPDPGAELKELWLLDNSPMPVEAWEVALSKADPDDDRVQLARAAHATLTGRFEEARLLLDMLQAGNADDPAIRRAQLDLAVASGDAARIDAATAILPAEALNTREQGELRARRAELSGDVDSERLAWLTLLESDPGNPRALERLAALAAAAGRADEAADYQRKKTEIDRAKDQFRKLLLRNDLDADAGELSTLARQLGNDFEADAWALLARVGRTGWMASAARVESSVDHEIQPADTRTLSQVLGSSPSRTPATSSESEVSPPTPPVFRERAEESGLRFVFDHGVSSDRLLPETMSGGVGLIDFDGDGWLDVFVVQGGPLHDPTPTPRQPDRLFRNRGDGTFEDVTESSGIASLPRGYGLGVAVGDYDNDGHPDLFITRLQSYALWRNRGDGTFEDATEAAGLSGRRDNPTSAAFADLDGDGDLDLYVCHYMVYDPANPIRCLNDEGEFFYCDPSRVEAAPDRLFRNDGGRFVDVTEEAGITAPEGRGLGVVAADLDDDGLVDLYVANDGTANFFYRNLGDLKFEEVGLSSGLAGSGDGGYQASMGVALGDQDRDGRLDLLVTNFYGEGSTLYHNLGSGQFADRTGPSGLGLATRYLLGFGTSFLDYDADGWLDLITANGHVNDNRPFYPYAMPAQLLAGRRDGRLVDVSRGAGSPWDSLLVGRGLAVGDLDNDGAQDILILPQGQPLAFLHNQTPGASRSLTLALEGRESNRDGVNARVIVELDGRRQVAERFGGGSYQSAGAPRLYFGLGDAQRADLVEVRWPSGRIDRYPDLEAGRGYRLIEGDPEPRPLPRSAGTH